jgi:hypothetical protein
MISPEDSKEAADASDMTHIGSKGTKEDIEKARQRQHGARHQSMHAYNAHSAYSFLP